MTKLLNIGLKSFGFKINFRTFVLRLVVYRLRKKQGSKSNGCFILLSYLVCIKLRFLRRYKGTRMNTFFQVAKFHRSAAVSSAPLNEIEIGDLSKTDS